MEETQMPFIVKVFHEVVCETVEDYDEVPASGGGQFVKIYERVGLCVVVVVVSNTRLASVLVDEFKIVGAAVPVRVV
jgi:hypothetical protein